MEPRQRTLAGYITRQENSRILLLAVLVIVGIYICDKKKKTVIVVVVLKKSDKRVGADGGSKLSQPKRNTNERQKQHTAIIVLVGSI